MKSLDAEEVQDYLESLGVKDSTFGRDATTAFFERQFGTGEWLWQLGSGNIQATYKKGLQCMKTWYW